MEVKPRFNLPNSVRMMLAREDRWQSASKQEAPMGKLGRRDSQGEKVKNKEAVAQLAIAVWLSPEEVEL